MQAFLLTIHILAVLGLIGVVLLQRSEGGALGIGMSSFMTGRGQANLLTRTTMVLAVVFFITSLSLTILAGFGSAQRSLLQGIPQGTGQGINQGAGQGSDTNNGSQQTTPSAPSQNGAGSLLDQLQKLEQQRSGANNSGSAPIRVVPPSTTPAAPPPAQPVQTPSSPPAPPAN